MSETNGRPPREEIVRAETLPLQRADDRNSVLWDPQTTNHAWALAKGLARSTLIPKHFQGKEADVFVALMMAKRMDEDVFAVMQSMHVINGKAGWSAAYLIARAKRAGVNVRWKVERLQPTKLQGFENLAVTAWAVLPGETERVEVTVTTQQAIEAGWTSNAQYRHSCELMLTYRSATWLIRRYLPEILLGYHTTDELDDVQAANRRQDAPTIDAVYEDASAPSPVPQGAQGGAIPARESGAQATLGAALAQLGLSEEVVDRFRASQNKPPIGTQAPDVQQQFVAWLGGKGRAAFQKWQATASAAASEAPHEPVETQEVEVQRDPPTPAPDERLTGPMDREELVMRIGDYEAALGSAIVGEIAKASGIPLHKNTPVLDNVTDEALGIYLHALAKREAVKG